MVDILDSRETTVLATVLPCYEFTVNKNVKLMVRLEEKSEGVSTILTETFQSEPMRWTN